MGISRGGIAALGLTAGVFLFGAGHYVGGGSAGGDYQITAQRPTAAAAAPASAAPAAAVSVSPSPPGAAGGARVNINTADEAALQQLPGIGPQRAADIVAYRAENGPFRYPEDITRVPGIGEGILTELIDLITVEEDAP